MANRFDVNYNISDVVSGMLEYRIPVRKAAEVIAGFTGMTDVEMSDMGMKILGREKSFDITFRRTEDIVYEYAMRELYDRLKAQAGYFGDGEK
ncbi:MAG: hypothetical protein AABX51_01615 [Nanoarchaeota archaeon]